MRPMKRKEALKLKRREEGWRGEETVGQQW